MTEDLKTSVQQVLRLSHEKHLLAVISALDFSYLISIDRKTGLARMRFTLDRDDKIPQMLCLIRLIVDSCKEAGAKLLEVELEDGSHSVLLSVLPSSGVASVKITDGCRFVEPLNKVSNKLISLDDCSWFVMDRKIVEIQESPNVHILLQALGASMDTLLPCNAQEYF